MNPYDFTEPWSAMSVVEQDALLHASCGTLADFERRAVTFRRNDCRRITTRHARRSVPLWPQLAKILEPYWTDRRESVAGDSTRLLLPTKNRAGEEVMICDMRKLLRKLAAAAGLDPDRVHPHGLRHTYCAARLRTPDRGHPVNEFTVAREMGHGGRSLIDRMYGHLGTVRHCAEWLEFKVSQHRKRDGYADRLRAMVERAASPEISGRYSLRTTGVATTSGGAVAT